MAQRWFEHSVRVEPNHTDYAAIVWHGSYLAWMEAARISALREVGIEFADLVQLGCDLPVVDLAIRYRQPFQMGDIAVVRSALVKVKKVRLYWEQYIYGPNYGLEQSKPRVMANVTLVPVNREAGQIIRVLPPQLQQAIEALQLSESVE